MTFISNLIKKYGGEVVKAAGVALVVLGLLPVIAQALGIAHIVVPSALLGFATVASGVIAGFIAWAKEHGITPAAVVAKLRR